MGGPALEEDVSCRGREHDAELIGVERVQKVE